MQNVQSKTTLGNGLERGGSGGFDRCRTGGTLERSAARRSTSMTRGAGKIVKKSRPVQTKLTADSQIHDENNFGSFQVIESHLLDTA